MNAPIGLAFILLIVLMFLIYYQGLIADLGAVQSLGTNWSYALTGRSSTGVPSNYPTTAKA
jgi:hypothetical protein